MTDQREPTPNDPTPDDATSRVPTPTADADADTGRPADGAVDAGRARPPRPRRPSSTRSPGRPGPSRPARSCRRRRRVAAVASAGRSASPSSRSSSLASAAVAALVTGQSSTSTVLGYVPADTIVYGEVRLDLPGDQRAAVGEFLSKFPGFADQAALDTKLDEVLDQLVKDATERRTVLHHRHQAVVRRRARLQRRAAAAGRVARQRRPVRPRHVPGAGPPVDQGPGARPGLVRRGDRQDRRHDDHRDLQRRDPDRLRAVGRRDRRPRHRSTARSPSPATSPRSRPPSTRRAPAASPPSPVPRPPSTRSTATTSASATSRSARCSTGRTSSTRRPTSALGGVADGRHQRLDPQARPRVDRLLAPLRERRHRHGGDRASAGDGDRADREPQLDDRRARAGVGHLRGRPATTSASPSRRCSTCTRSDPAYKPILDQLDQGLDLVGGADAAFGWVRDTAVVVDAANGTPEGGLIVEPTDADAARQLFTALRTFLTLGGDQVGVDRPRRGPTTARRSRSSPSATSAR